MGKWMELKGTMLSAISQTQKDKHQEISGKKKRWPESRGGSIRDQEGV
jgi:hypothetical protein